MVKRYTMRVTWDNYFLGIMEQVASRATCDRGKSGCVIVSPKKRITATGYVGSPCGLPHCDDVGHDLIIKIHSGVKSEHCVRTIHAEQNAIAQAASEGVSIDGCTIYCTMVPCIVCTRLLIQCGIKRIVCKYDYHDSGKSKYELTEAGVKLEIQNDEVNYGPKNKTKD